MPNFVVEITLGIIENSYIIHRRTDDRGLFVACPPSLYSRATPACAKEYPDSGETYCERTIYSIYQVPLDEGHQNS
ncbi:uncharacterized protein L969DRAFT_90290 [Mixia osmundae IAM 14324]|uniref:uncharacterized protein n=1 Tax=Mixia osmundae (strain CBS 9802 / IAM 14324 / JCM 22182 / KY 12970) TaxID=764103 RepID=UPI0004A547B6|nr:uncharacterized protein L969DRAFT_90290 [Mixia osmundae IAM 14324]KEI37219.1 hypothetical protein L969DRAFT_90290 [Mixia osmundae IAM 14324]